MQVLAVIPARGGSKGIPGKNLRPLGGRPLIAHTLDAAKGSRAISRVVVSTDDPAIADVARAHGVEVPFMRPAHLSADDTPMLDVLRHCLAVLHTEQGYVPDTVVLLQPTSPLRTSQRIDEAVRALIESGADSVVTVVEVPHQFSPTSVMGLDGERLVPCVDAGRAPTRRQDKPRLFARNGPAVLAVRRTVIEGGALYGRDCRPLVMRAEESIDVDEPFDLEIAEWLLARRVHLG